MGRRILLFGLGVGVAAFAALALLYQDSGKTIDRVNPDLTAVIVSQEEIPPGKRLLPLIEQGVLFEIEVPKASLVEGAVTDLRELECATTTTTILANEQIPISRFTNDSECYMNV